MAPATLRAWRGTLLFITAAECVVQLGAAVWQARFQAPARGLFAWIAHTPAFAAIAAVGTLVALA